MKLGAERTAWSVVRDGRAWADFEFRLGGEYNVWNATAAAALAANFGISKDVIAKALASFRSVKRRLEVKAEVNGITIIDDFAHHPTAIEQTIRALRARYPQSRLWVVLEPRSNTMRRNVLQDALARSLALADEVVVAAIFKSEAIPEPERLDLNRVIDDVQKRGKQARIFADADAIVNAIAPELRQCDVVAILSNGGFGGIYEKLPQRLRHLGVKALGVNELGKA
jgi:UDP-N-acetylmuramate: L-alanyl-gamma-D-glutamyl-meso-diaminopimelate ligase